MAAKAIATELVTVGSHSVSADHFAGEHTREECYPKVNATWRGAPVLVELEANRYRHTGGWSEWRIFARRTDPGSTELAIRALTEACRPLVEDWLESDAYTESRRRAFSWMVTRAIRDAGSRYSIDRLREHLERYRDELEPARAVELAEAIDHLEAMEAALEGSNGRNRAV